MECCVNCNSEYFHNNTFSMMFYSIAGIRQLQCILLKVALVVGVEVHVNVGFVDILEPTTPGMYIP